MGIHPTGFGPGPDNYLPHFKTLFQDCMAKKRARLLVFLVKS